jgi:anti-anti-sigma factor
MSATAQIRVENGVTVIRLGGELTAGGVPEIESEVRSALDGGGGVVCDLSEVRLITTPGITLLLSASDQVEARGNRLIFSGVRGTTAEILLDRCRLDLVLTLAPTIEAAVKAAR